MGIYSKAYLEDADVDLKLDEDDFHDHDPVEDAMTGTLETEDPIIPMEEAYRIIGQTEHNFNEMMKVLGGQELQIYSETGLEALYESGQIKSIIDKFIAIVKSWFAKIADATSRFIAAVKARMTGDKNFLAKNRAAIEKGYKKLPGSVKISGYRFKHTNVSSSTLISTSWRNVKAEFNFANVGTDAFGKGRDKSELDASAATIRKLIAQASKPLMSDKAFRQAANELFYENAAKVEITKQDYSSTAVIANLESKGVIETVKSNYDAIKKEINEVIKHLKELKGKIREENDDKKNANAALKDLSQVMSEQKHILSCITVLYNSQLGAINKRYSQARAFATKCISYAESKTTGVGESTGFLSGLQLV